jgi:hypothetical protein
MNATVDGDDSLVAQRRLYVGAAAPKICLVLGIYDVMKDGGRMPCACVVIRAMRG